MWYAICKPPQDFESCSEEQSSFNRGVLIERSLPNFHEMVKEKCERKTSGIFMQKRSDYVPRENAFRTVKGFFLVVWSRINLYCENLDRRSDVDSSCLVELNKLL